MQSDKHFSLRSFVVGFAASLLATVSFYLCTVFINILKFARFEGYVIEYSEDRPTNPISIGKLDFKGNFLRYDGVNFALNGDQCEVWWTSVSNFDLDTNEYQYIYNYTRPSLPGIGNTGYGTMKMTEADDKIYIDSGTFFSAAMDKEPIKPKAWLIKNSDPDWELVQSSFSDRDINPLLEYAKSQNLFATSDDMFDLTCPPSSN
ncbi:MAG: hypothetical protein AAFX52_05735 [Pseudomonadota bacterium]